MGREKKDQKEGGGKRRKGEGLKRFRGSDHANFPIQFAYLVCAENKYS